MNKKEIKIIELPSEVGAGTRGASLGPQSVYLNSLKEKSGLFENMEWVVANQWNDDITIENPTPNAKNIALVFKALQEGYAHVSEVLQEQKKPLIFSGDHSNASAGISAVSNLVGKEKMGVVWIDAHSDLHSPYTTPSGNMHGMPLAAMLGEDNLPANVNFPTQDVKSLWEQIKTLGNGKSKKILPKNIVFIAIRDLEAQEWELIKRLNIKYFEPKDIKELGIEEVCKQTKAYLKEMEQYYVSFDVDSVDPSISVGTGTPVAKGLSKEEAYYCTSTFFNDPKTAAFEITEINPLLDTENKMASFIHGLLENLLGVGKK